MRRMTLTVLLCLAACGGSDASGRQGASPPSFMLDESPHPPPGAVLPGGGVPPLHLDQRCEPATEQDRPREPETPIGTNNNLGFVMRFPEDANDTPRGRTYWLTGDEHAFVNMEIRSGDQYEGPARSMTLVVFVNGLQVAPLIDGAEAHKLEFVLEPHTSRTVELEFDESVLPLGLHQIALAVWDRGSPAGVGPVVYAIREKWCFPDRLRFLTGEVEPWNVDWGSAYWVVDPRTDLLPPEVPLGPDEDLELELFYAAGQVEVGEPRYLVALVDGEQVPFEDWGPSPVLQVEVGTSLRTRVRIAGERFPGNRARVDLFEIGGVHQPAEDASGNLIRLPTFRAARLESFDVIRP